eukprot:6912584-Prymnesium_polylepis.2
MLRTPRTHPRYCAARHARAAPSLALGQACMRVWRGAPATLALKGSGAYAARGVCRAALNESRVARVTRLRARAGASR